MMRFSTALYTISFALLIIVGDCFEKSRGKVWQGKRKFSPPGLLSVTTFTEHNKLDTSLASVPNSQLFDTGAWLKWTTKVVPVVACIGLVSRMMGGSVDTILMMSTMIVFGLMFMEIMEGGKIPFDAVGREGLNNAANKINKLGRESVLIITGGIVISVLAVLDFFNKRKVIAEK